MKKVMIAVFAALTVMMSMSSCEEESKTYEVKILNECYMDFLNTGIPFMKIQIDEVKFNGDLVATNITAPNGEGSTYRVSSDYFNIESAKDYDISIKFTTFIYDSEELAWGDGIQDEYLAGTETWTSDEEYSKFALKFTVGDILNAYRPEYESFYVE